MPWITHTSPFCTLVEYRTRIWASASARWSLTACPLRSWLATRASSHSCRRVSPSISGWKATARMLPCRTATGWPSTSASTSTPSPCSSTHGARMNTAAHRRRRARRGRGRPRSCCTWRPKALRSARTSSRPRWSRSSMISPAQVPSIGRARARRASRSGSARPSRSIPSVIVVDSPPGITRPSSPSRSAGVADLARARRRGRSSTLRVRLEVALEGEHADERTGYQPRFWSRPPVGSSMRVHLDAGHRRAEVARGGGDALGVLEVRGGLDDGGGGALGVLGLEDARAHEHALGAEPHHQRGVGRGGDAAGGEHDHRQPARLGHVADQVERRLQLLGGGRQLGLVERRRAGGSRRRSSACGARPRPRCRCRPRPC